MLTVLISILGSGAFLGAFGWVLQLGTRVTKIEIKQEDLPDLINTQFADVGRRLDRIERAMNGALKYE